MNISLEDLEWIETFYSDFEAGHYAIGKTYVRPTDYIERALNVIYGTRKPLGHSQEGKKRSFKEEI